MKKITVIFIIIAVIMVIIGILFLSNKGTKQTGTSSVTPTQSGMTPTRLPDIPQNVRSLIISDLPYEQQEFLVEYLPAVDKFYVTILEEPYDKNYRKALLWLTQKGVDNPSNNAKIEFVFAGYRDYQNLR